MTAIASTAWAHTAATAVAELAEPAWSLRPEVVAPLVVLAALYACGWWRLTRRARPGIGARRPLAALVGLAALALALLSPLDRLAETRFVFHMAQHMLLIAVAAPAWLLADPFPFLVWALPRGGRRRLGRWIGRGSPVGRLWRASTGLTPAWFVFAGVLWGWHLPSAYDAAVSQRAVHDLEHATFFLAALLFWWPVIRPAPRLRRPASYPARVVHLVLGAFQTAALGLALTLAPRVLYGGVESLDDQAWGGVVMWATGGLVDMLAVLVLVYRTLGVERQRPMRLDRSAVPPPPSVPHV